MSESKDAAAGIHKEYDPFLIPRQEMVAQQLQGRGISDQRVLDAMLRVPRHEFTPESYREQAYEDHPLPIGEGQTISQPYIVASMLAALSLQSTDKVLEVGSGSGYVTALLAELVAHVFAIERHAELATRARESDCKAWISQCRDCSRRRQPRFAAISAFRRGHCLCGGRAVALAPARPACRWRPHDHSNRRRRRTTTATHSSCKTEFRRFHCASLAASYH